MRADRVVRRDGFAELVLLREREPPELREAARLARRVDARCRKLPAVEDGPIEEVRELSAVGRVVERELLVPGTSLDLRLEDLPDGLSGGS